MKCKFLYVVSGLFTYVITLISNNTKKDLPFICYIFVNFIRKTASDESVSVHPRIFPMDYSTISFTHWGSPCVRVVPDDVRIGGLSGNWGRAGFFLHPSDLECVRDSTFVDVVT